MVAVNTLDNQAIIDWLLDGDVSIQYQVHRDLLGKEHPGLQSRIATEGWGKSILSKRLANGHWGADFYSPKWISSHYTLLDLRNLSLSSDNLIAKETIDMILETEKAMDGGIKLGPSTAHHSDICVNAMLLNYASYFKTDQYKLHSIVDCILSEVMPDGGFNCLTQRTGSVHSSLHTTISVLEGLFEFIKNGYSYRSQDIIDAKKAAVEFLLLHQLYLSDRTGEIINANFLKMPYPCRWKYDIFRALDYFQYACCEWNYRLAPALEVLNQKKNKDNTWNMNAAHPGKVHIVMEKAGKPSRWNTLRSLRIFKWYYSFGF